MLKVYLNLAQEPGMISAESMEESKNLNIGIDYSRTRPSERSGG